MDKKLTETVFFIKDLSVEEEYKIVNSKVEEDPELHIINENRKHVQQTSGNVFYRSSKSLYAHADLFNKPLDKDSDNRLNALLVALCFLDPFRNFLEGMASKLDDRIFEIPTAAKIMEIVEYLKKKNDEYFPDQTWAKLDVRISPLFKNVFYLHDELQRLFHDDLVRRYKFTEDVWEDSDARAKVKSAYPQFSPLVDLFHVKVKKPLDKAAKLEYVTSFEIDCKATDIAEYLRQFDRGDDRDGAQSVVVKHPHILTLKLSSASGAIPEEVSLSHKKYALKAFVASSKGSYVTCIRNRGGYVQLGPGSVKEGGEMPQPLLAFYVATKYDFDF